MITFYWREIQIYLYTLQTTALLPSFASHVICMEASPVDPNLVAVGGGDSTIRVWKTASSRPGFDVSLVWQKLSSKITAIAWHPEKEGLLAFGTDEGRIGTVDALHSRPTPNMWEHKHRGAVYNLAWGPNLKPPLGVKLYSCGDNVVLMHHGQKGNRPSNVEDVIEETNKFKRKVGTY